MQRPFNCKIKCSVIVAFLILFCNLEWGFAEVQSNSSGANPAQINEELGLQRIKESTAKKEESAAGSRASAERFALWRESIIFLIFLLGSVIGFRKRIKIFLVKIAWKRYLKRVTELFKLLCSNNTVCQRYLTSLLRLYVAEDENNKIKALMELRQAVCDSSEKDIPGFMIEGGLKVITNKCKDNDENISKAAFNCFTVFYTSYKQLSPEVFLTHFADLFNRKSKKHVERNAIIEFCAYAQTIRPSIWNDNSRFVAFMKEIYNRLFAIESWSDEDMLAVTLCIKSLECIQDLPDAVNELLLLATEAAERDVNRLLNSFYTAVLTLKNISQLDYQKIQLVCAKLSSWLKRPDVNKEFKDNLIPAIINHLDPQRGLRKSVRITKIRKIYVYADDRKIQLSGELINISETGVCFKLNNYSLVRKTTQFRRPGEDGFLLRGCVGQEMRLGQAFIDICKSNGKEVCVSTKGELLRAWVPPSSSKISESGFGAIFTNDNNLDELRSFITSN